MKAWLFVIMLLINPVILSFSQKAPVIHNLDFSLIDNKLVITYDIANSNKNDRYNLKVEIFKASGEKIDAKSFSGDLYGVQKVKGNRIIWDIDKDNIFLDDDIYVVVSGELMIVADIDGNIYNVIHIGTQLWMKENLKTTKYNDGTNIPLVTDNTAWRKLTTPGYCWYNNDASTYKEIYGALYNWYAVNTGKLCPVGWHVPTDNEWKILVNYLGGSKVAGGKLKSTGTIEKGTGLWHSPNTRATNKTGFTAVPGGGRDPDGYFDIIGFGGGWWSSTVYSSTYAWVRGMVCYGGDVYRDPDNKTSGFSVRCVRD